MTKYLCTAPWTHTYVSPQGERRLCCASREDAKFTKQYLDSWKKQLYLLKNKKILEKAPHYQLIYKVKPGITSWGMVKFGYAENVDEMIERLKFDIIYLENLSLISDFKVFILTILSHLPKISISISFQMCPPLINSSW